MPPFFAASRAIRRPSLGALLGLAALTMPRAVASQGQATFKGTIVDISTSRPLAGTRVTFHGSGAVALSDSLGRFEIPGLPMGIHRFTVFRTGFPRAQLTLAFAPGETLERILEMDSTGVGRDTAVASPGAQPLPLVTVTSALPGDRRFVDFERRQRTGRGQYLRRREIELAQYSRLTDAMRNLRGVNVECGGGAGCYIRMARAPIGCLPEYIVDEQVNNSFGPLTPIRDIEAIEVYLGASDVPGEFAGVNAGCGVIVIWTRNGPPRRPPT